jgi:hypothetical protein
LKYACGLSRSRARPLGLRRAGSDGGDEAENREDQRRLRWHEFLLLPRNGNAACPGWKRNRLPFARRGQNRRIVYRYAPTTSFWATGVRKLRGLDLCHR